MDNTPRHGDDAVREQQANYPDDPFKPDNTTHPLHGQTHEHKFSRFIDNTAEHVEAHVKHHWLIEEQWALRMGLESVEKETILKLSVALRNAAVLVRDLCDVVCECSDGEPIAPGDAHSAFCRAFRAERDIRMILRHHGLDANEGGTK